MSSLERSEVVRLSSLPVTSVERTLLDLSAREKECALEELLDEALRRRLTSVDKLTCRLELERRRPGSGTLRRLLSTRRGCDPLTESRLEARLERVVKHFGLPLPERQVEPVLPEIGTVRLDFAYRKERVAIEADGYRYHSGRQAWQRDLKRQAALMKLGWRVARFSWEDVHRQPSQVASVIASFLGTNVRLADLEPQK